MPAGCLVAGISFMARPQRLLGIGVLCLVPEVRIRSWEQVADETSFLVALQYNQCKLHGHRVVIKLDHPAEEEHPLTTKI